MVVYKDEQDRNFMKLLFITLSVLTFVLPIMISMRMI